MTRLLPLCIGFVLSGQIISPGFAQSKLQEASLEEHAKAIAALLEGKMDTIASSPSSNTPGVRMTTCRIRVTDAEANPSTIFLYQEQALIPKLSQPYRQRFLEIAPDAASQSVRSRAFKLTNPAQWVGRCDKATSAKVTQLKDFGEPICNVFLKPQQKGYIGYTPPAGCPANVRGAVRITNQIELTEWGMKTWDRGFDATGKQVWGAKNEAYQFRRLED